MVQDVERRIRRMSSELAQLRVRMMEVEFDFTERIRRLEDDIVTCRAAMMAQEEGEEVSVYTILRSLLHTHFSTPETKALCFDLGLGLDRFAGDLPELHMKIIEHCRQNDMMDELTANLRRARPRVSWPDL